MKLPVYRLAIDETIEGMDYIGLVDAPAHGKTWATMSKAEKKIGVKQHFNGEKQIVTGVAIATSQLIFRRDPDGYEYNVYLTKQDTFEIMKMFVKKGYHNNVNLMHDQGKKVKDAYLLECYFIKDDKSNIPVEFADQNLQPGSVVFSYWIEGKKSWEFVKEHGVGFSLEGWFKQIPVKFMTDKTKHATISIIEKYDIEIIENDITIGTKLTQKDYEDRIVDLRSGEYIYNGHKILVDSDGVVQLIDGEKENITLRKKKQKPNKMSKTKKSLMERLGFAKTPEKATYNEKSEYATAVNTDGETLEWEGDLAEGVSIFIIPEEGEPVLAPEGPMSIEIDGVMSVVEIDENGVVTSVKDVDSSDEDEDEDEEFEEVMKAMKKEYETKFSKQEERNTENEKKIIEMAKTIDELTESVEKLSEQKTPKKKTSIKSGYASLKGK